MNADDIRKEASKRLVEVEAEAAKIRLLLGGTDKSKVTADDYLIALKSSLGGEAFADIYRNKDDAILDIELARCATASYRTDDTSKDQVLAEICKAATVLFAVAIAWNRRRAEGFGIPVEAMNQSLRFADAMMRNAAAGRLHAIPPGFFAESSP